jgi:hypothetical protein
MLPTDPVQKPSDVILKEELVLAIPNAVLPVLKNVSVLPERDAE